MAEIGSTLREARMRARVDITEVETGTKIRAKYLRALENEEWDLLPGPVYVRSFLKTYGDYLGLDSRLLVDEFRRRYERPMEHDASAMAAATARDRERRRKPSARVANALFSPRSVIVVALAAIVVALYLIGNHGRGANNTHNVVTPTTTTNGNHGTGTDTGATHTHTNPPPPRPPAHATLALVPTAAIWVCVENAAGHPLFPAAIFNPGQRIPTTHGRELRVTLGNTHANATINGKPYTLTGSNAISLRITPHGASPLTPAPTCGQ